MARYLNVLSQAAGKNGQALGGATLGFFETSSSGPTSVFQDTFQDEALTIVNTNPVVANGEGRFPDIFLQAKKYFVEFKDAGGSIKDSADNVTGLVVEGASTLSNIAALTVLFKSSLIDGVVFEVDAYSVKGDNGGGRFQWFATGSESTATENLVTIFESDEGGTGRWFRLFSGPLQVQLCCRLSLTHHVFRLSIRIPQNCLFLPYSLYHT